MAATFIVQKWRPNLLRHPFNILTDYQTLKHFLNQRITTPNQQKCPFKLLGYNYTLEHHPGFTNIVVDALLKQHECLALMGLSNLFLTVS